MSELNTTLWEKELRALLDRLQAHPSRESAAERQRIAVLTHLIAARGKVAA